MSAYNCSVKSDLLLEIDKLYKELYGSCCPNLFNISQEHSISDLQGLKVVLLAKLFKSKE